MNFVRYAKSRNCYSLTVGFVAISLVRVLSTPGDSTLSAQESAQQAGARVSNELTAIARLRQIEERAMPLPLVKGVPRHESLGDYYWEANQSLRYRLDAALRAFHTGNPRPYRAMTLIAGSAGVGKTFVKRGIYNDSVADKQIWKFDIRELFEQMAEEELVVAQPDIQCRDQVISQLLSLTDQGRKQFIARLTQQAPKFVVVDSLDEVHPNDYRFVLEALEQFALKGNRDFIHVVICGRPLAFHDYLRTRQSRGMPHGLRAFVLNPPEFRTTGDLLVSSWNYGCWKHGLARTRSDGQTSALSFVDFERWCNLDFATSGAFGDVTFKQNNSLCPSVRDELRDWTSRHRVVTAVLPNLAGNSMLRDIVEAHVKSKQEFDEREFMNEFAARWLERNTRSGDRPSRLKPELLDLYMELLEQVAAKYVAENRINRLGFFDVVDDDHVTVQHSGQQVSVPVCELLDHSGVVTLDPVLPIAQRYRFEPFWMHRLLLTMHQDRRIENATFVNADK